jgi:rubrerythrin
MSKKSKEKLAKLKEGICPFCGYDCHDKESLDRHIDWVHKKEVLS